MRYPDEPLAVMAPVLVDFMYEYKFVIAGYAPVKYTSRLLDKLPYDHDQTNGVFALMAVLSVNFHGVLQVFKVHITEGAHVMETSQDPYPNANPVAVKAIKPPDGI
jgi:hypothetical protein